jgi:ABC-2 type transport system ATP-binding protein
MATAGSDPRASESLLEDLAGLAAKEGVTVFLTTHNLAEAEKLLQLVGIIRDGRLIARNPPSELRTRGRPPVTVSGKGFSDELLEVLRRTAKVVSAELEKIQLVIELHPGAEPAPVIRQIVNLGAEIEEVRKVSLEDVFVTLMKEEE